MAKPTLTHARVRELLTWDSANGVFRWRAATGAANTGAVAGTYTGKYKRVGIDGAQYPISTVQALYGLDLPGAGLSRELPHLERGDSSEVVVLKKNVHRCQVALGTAEKKYHTLQTRWRIAEQELAVLRAALSAALNGLETAASTRARQIAAVEERARANGVGFKVL